MEAFKGRLIDTENLHVVSGGLLVIDGERILYAGEERGYCLPEDCPVRVLEGKTLMPGMIDCHAHLSAEESMDRTGRTPYDLLLTAAYDCGILVDAGVTGVRDMSAFGAALSRAVEKGLIRGPRIMPGGRVISVTAGHADMDTTKSVEEINRTSLISYLADGKEGCLKAVRQQFRDGARFIKICATGGVSSSVDNPNDVQFSEEELEVMVAEAERRSSYVAAHCTGLKGTLQAIRAGVHSVEHGVNLNEECVSLMKEKNITLVSTCYVPFTMHAMKGLTEEMSRKAMACVATIKKGYALAHKAGVRLAMGTDFSNSPNTPYQRIGLELKYICECGYSPLEAIQAATRNGAYLMNMEGETGVLSAGMLADFLIVDGRPDEDIEILGNAENISEVYMAGRRVKG